MPSLTYTVRARREGDTVQLTIDLPTGGRIERRVTLAKVDTPEKLAAWVLAQREPDDGAVPALEGRHVVQYELVDGAPVVERVTRPPTGAA